MQQIKDISIEAQRDNALFSEKPSPEKIKNMYEDTFKGITYQRIRGNHPQGDQKDPPKVPKNYNQHIEPSVEIP
jgi:hypothetical protein